MCKWLPELGNNFSENNATKCCLRCFFFFLIDFDDDYVTAIERLWSIVVPSIINAFGWSLLQDKLPTRVKLWRRNVISDVHQQCCVWCFNDIESASHLFVMYPKTLEY